MPSGEENQIFGVDHFSQALHGTHSLILVLKHFVFPALLFQLIYLLSLQMKGSENRQAHQLREAQRARTHVHYVCAFEHVFWSQVVSLSSVVVWNRNVCMYC